MNNTNIQKNKIGMSYTFTRNNEEKYKYTLIHPLLEIYRKRIINKLFSTFYNLCKRYNNRFREDKAIDFMTRFCWKNIGTIDPVIPYNENNKYEDEQLRIDLKNYGFDADRILRELDISKLLSKYISEFDKYYNEIFNNTIDKKDENEIVMNDEIIKYGDDSVRCSKEMFINMKNFYNGDVNDMMKIIFCILMRYSILDANNQQLSVLPELKNVFYDNFGVNAEIFGSCINRTYSLYCSIYYDLEKSFGSIGNFFNNNYDDGLYLTNPPFDETIMRNTAKHLLECLDNSKKGLGFIVVFPVWNYEISKMISKKCDTKYQDYGKYDIYDILNKSKYTKRKYVFCKNDLPFYNFRENRRISAVNTYIFIVINDKINIDINKMDMIMKKYNPIVL